jgi:hypothetical protein
MAVRTQARLPSSCWMRLPLVTCVDSGERRDEGGTTPAISEVAVRHKCSATLDSFETNTLQGFGTCGHGAFEPDHVGAANAAVRYDRPPDKSGGMTVPHPLSLL